MSKRLRDGVMCFRLQIHWWWMMNTWSTATILQTQFAQFLQTAAITGFAF